MEKPSLDIAVLDSNTLAALGLKHLLQTIMPIAEVELFGSMAELEANQPQRFVHYFVAMNIVLEHRAFFMAHKHKTIVLTTSTDEGRQLHDFNCICTAVPERQLIRAFIALEQHAHAGGKNLPPMATNAQQQPILSDREAEVMVLIVKGYINKQIADQLHIGLSTVVTHRKNIMEKLGVRSVSALTIYAVMHGYVDINKI
ncbi:MAG: response regulator transcription factor [Prevotella sp.]|nr:response regulator transcription factor [Prevotella sp.]